ncbi:Pyrroline-5-Carboxylate Reductase 2 [Manis pentadactyla]|nr:Pyrroline-5-Carboxylate Reductase 2 [Manis pentadactyla]
MKGQVGEFLREEIGLEECIGNGHGKEGNIKELCLGMPVKDESPTVATLTGPGTLLLLHLASRDTANLGSSQVVDTNQ